MLLERVVYGCLHFWGACGWPLLELVEQFRFDQRSCAPVTKFIDWNTDVERFNPQMPRYWHLNAMLYSEGS